MKKSRVGPYNPEAATALAVVLHRHLTHPDTDRMCQRDLGRDRGAFWRAQDKWEISRGTIRVDSELVRAFQGAAGIVDDGRYDAATAGALNYWFCVSGRSWETEGAAPGVNRIWRWCGVAVDHYGDLKKLERIEVLYVPPDGVERLAYHPNYRRYRDAGLRLLRVLRHSEPVAQGPVSFEREVSPYFDPGFEDWPGALAEFVTITSSCGCGRFNGECLCEISQIGSESFFHEADEDVDVVDVLDVFTDSK